MAVIRGFTLSCSRPAASMATVNIRQHTAKGSFSEAMSQLKRPSPDRMDSLISSLKILQVYNIPKARLIPKPAAVTRHPRFATGMFVTLFSELMHCSLWVEREGG